MKSFVIHDLKKNLKLKTSIYFEDGFRYKINSNSIKIKEIVILDPYIIDQLILTNFNKRYKKILECYLTILQDESDEAEGDFMMALDEVARLRNILIRKYNLIVSKKIEEKMLKKLKILENEMRTKVIDIKLIKEQEQTLIEESVVNKRR